MKYCTKCGKEIMDEAVICPHCGCATSQGGINNVNSSTAQAESHAGTAQIFAVLGLFLAFLAIGAIIYAKKSEESNGGVMIKKAHDAYIVGIVELCLWAAAIILFVL